MKKQPYNVINRTSRTILASMAAFFLSFFFSISRAIYMQGYTAGEVILFFLSIFFICIPVLISLIPIFLWWKNENRESTYQGEHTGAVQMGLRYGMILFIVSEMIFFLFIFCLCLLL